VEQRLLLLVVVMVAFMALSTVLRVVMVEAVVVAEWVKTREALAVLEQQVKDLRVVLLGREVVLMAPLQVEEVLALLVSPHLFQSVVTEAQELHRLFQAHKFNMRLVVGVEDITFLQVQPQEE
jgi:hypothetical protein